MYGKGKFLNFLLDFFLPELCVICGKKGELLCDSCYSNLAFLSVPICPLCGAEKTASHKCKTDFSYLDGVRSLLKFTEDVRRIIHSYKYAGVWRLERRFSTPLSNLLMSDMRLKSADLITFIPLHPLKKFMRGFNQAELLCKGISEVSELECAHLLKRIKFTKSQTGIENKKKRRENIRGAFILKKTDVGGKRIVVVDDVITTGATLEEVSKVLKKGGAKEVYGLTLANAM